MSSTVNTSDHHVPVLIVGGGIVGLSAALFLQRHGITPLLVERHEAPSIHPRARAVSARTMELFRELGLEQAIRDAGAALAPAFGVLRGTSLLGGLASAPARNGGEAPQLPSHEASPTTGCRCTQDLLEPVLLRAARERGGDIRFGTLLSSFTQDGAGVTATLVDVATGTETRVRADYMIAADGARGAARSALGIPMSGRGGLAYLLNILFRADMAELVRGREFSLCRIERPDMDGLFVTVDNRDRWVFHYAYDHAAGERPKDFPRERCVEIVRDALGLPELEITIESVLPWESAARVADRYRQGRVFLAGDAAHVIPPWGALGANTGVQDAHNLAWKLAMVLWGEADPSLLDTYGEERRPIARDAAEYSAALTDRRGIMDVDSVAATMKSRSGMLGGFRYRYASSGIIEESGAPRLDLSDPDGSPGTRAPHAWLELDGERISTLDLFGLSFVLLAGERGDAWRDAARLAADRVGIDIAAYCVGGAGEPREDGSWRRSAGIGAEGALLVRPDGFVAWRASGAGIDPVETLTAVFGALLAGHAEMLAAA